MSLAFLHALNGQNRGPFYRWLQRLEHAPRIAWYPSAGEDWRDLMYLHPNYCMVAPALGPEPDAPSLFLHSDYFPWGYPRFLDSHRAYHDRNTSVRIRTLEELPRLELPLDKRVVHFAEGGEVTGCVFFMELEVDSRKLGQQTVPLVYAFVENAALCATQMLPHQATISHVVHVRAGGGLCGGGFTNGTWMLRVLKRLGCEVFITDGHLQHQQGDDRVLELYPELAGPALSLDRAPLRTVPGAFWSGHGDVTWNLCAPVQPGVLA